MHNSLTHLSQRNKTLSLHSFHILSYSRNTSYPPLKKQKHSPLLNKAAVLLGSMAASILLYRLFGGLCSLFLLKCFEWPEPEHLKKNRIVALTTVLRGTVVPLIPKLWVGTHRWVMSHPKGRFSPLINVTS